MLLLFQIIVFLFSVMVHEVSHGAVAYSLGDDTAEKLNRLTLNPLKHLDFFGSILLPLLLIASQSPIIFGWAKPVPYNPENLKNPRRDAESFLSTEDYFLECFSLHSFIFLWSPEVRIVGTFSIFFLPFSLYSKISGLVYCGYSL